MLDAVVVTVRKRKTARSGRPMRVFLSTSDSIDQTPFNENSYQMRKQLRFSRALTHSRCRAHLEILRVVAIVVVRLEREARAADPALEAALVEERAVLQWAHLCVTSSWR